MSFIDQSRRISRFVVVLSSIWCTLIVVAPLLRFLGVSVSSVFYLLFSEVCHQIPERSFHIAGEPLAVCVRCSAIYFSFLASLLVAPFFVRFHFTHYPPAWVLIAAVAPTALDVLLNLAGLHGSTVWTRALTGVTAGLVIPFFLMPPLIEAIHQLAGKFGGLSHAGKTQ